MTGVEWVKRLLSGPPVVDPIREYSHATAALRRVHLSVARSVQHPPAALPTPPNGSPGHTP